MTPEQLLLIDTILTLPDVAREGVATEDRGDPRCDGVLRRGGGEVSPPCSAWQARRRCRPHDRQGRRAGAVRVRCRAEPGNLIRDVG